MSWDMRLKNPQKKAEPMICDGCFHNTVCRLDGNEMLEYCSARVPSANVVEVIRCKDCRYGWLEDDKDTVRYCSAHNIIKRVNDYCSRGERRKTSDSHKM